ncbi:hypothetical protein NLU13_6222 [Sarocladium strictum]|uniref:Uncharacterized protein n=1 Tax=Sarocladium strictum TaxID=5046 RepID=A0AA39GFH1_SARSR|nr:hypothetical protein NLU13_6222 [Sarocladium strictum]
MNFFKILWGISLHFLHSVSSQTIPEFDWASVRCPQSALETLPTPTYGYSGGLFTVCTELIFNAPAVEIYHALLDFQAYSSFSSFVIGIELPPQVRKTPDDVFLGLEMTFTTRGIFPIINTTSLEIVTFMEDSTDGGYMMTSWRYDDKLGGMFSRSEHPSILVEQSDGTTR